MNDKKLTYPKGIYASRDSKTPSFVLARVKIDCAKAIQTLQECDQPYYYTQVLRAKEPDDYGNVAFMAVDDYRMDWQRENASKGIAQAKAALAPDTPSKRQVVEGLPEDDIPF
jgi:hypothetical protein